MNLYNLHNKPKELYGYKKIMQNPKFLHYMYYNDQLPISVFRDNKKAFTRTPEDALNYVKLFTSRFPEGEDAIFTSPKHTFEYLDLIWEQDMDFTEFENALKDSPEYAYRYAAYFIGGRFPKGEEAILNSEYAEKYRKFMA